MGREDFAIPRISILQSLSPQLDKTDAAYIKGAEAGDIYDNVTNAVYKGETGIPVVLVAYRRTMLEWWPRGSSKGKGFVADHGLDQSQMARTTKNDKGAFITPEGTEIVNTAEYYAFILNDRGGADRVVLSMAKSQLKYSKRLNTMINQYQVQRPDGKGTFNPAMFYRIYMMKTMPEKNEKGNWFSWMVEPGMDLLKLPDGEKLYLEARAFRESVAEGKVKVSQGEGEDLPTEHEAF